MAEGLEGVPDWALLHLFRIHHPHAIHLRAEFHRLMALHAVLHLLGLEDGDPAHDECMAQALQAEHDSERAVVGLWN